MTDTDATLWPADVVERRAITELIPHARNARTHSDAQVAQVAGSIREWGWTIPVLVDEEGTIIAGHARVLAGMLLGLDTVPTMTARGWSDAKKRAYMLADNKLALNAGWDDELLRAELADLLECGLAGDLMGFGDDELRSLLGGLDTPAGSGALAERFGAVPFTVLNAREGWWQERKRAWIGLGIRSELGRDDVLMTTEAQNRLNSIKRAGQTLAAGKTFGELPCYDDSHRQAIAGTSIFDPVLCELAYRWFCPPAGAVLDPFAGGSVRGVVAAKLGHPYTGIDLSERQLAANREQWAGMDHGTAEPTLPELEPDALPDRTPVERHGAVWLKRDDTFRVGGGRGGKVRTCWRLAQGALGLVTAGSRSSPQVNIVAQIARVLGVPCRCHVPSGVLSPEVEMAQAAGAEIVQHTPGHNSVIIARARDDAKARGWREIPFGMECPEAVEGTAAQVAGLPEARRLVVPVGSGMSLAGILWGLQRAGLSLPVLGVVVGADPTKRLDRWAPGDWRERVTLVQAGLEYDQEAPNTALETVKLDPIYEAKCLPFLEPDDVLWVVGLRATATAALGRALAPDPVWVCGDSAKALDGPEIGPGVADMVFSCPPYADLEVYSDDPADLSGMEHDAFLAAYREIIAKACARLAPDRFAVWVVGEVRGPDGGYRNLVADTVAAFLAAGLTFWNEAILVTMVGTLPIRVGKQFAATRKLGKTHQNVLVFLKGDARRAVDACGPVETPNLDAMLEDVETDPGLPMAAE
jgi:hypothetical protein